MEKKKKIDAKAMHKYFFFCFLHFMIHCKSNNLNFKFFFFSFDLHSFLWSNLRFISFYGRVIKNLHSNNTLFPPNYQIIKKRKKKKSSLDFIIKSISSRYQNNP